MACSQVVLWYKSMSTHQRTSCSFDKIAEGIKIIRTHQDVQETDSTNLEALILTESRVRRMIVTLSVHSIRESVEAAISSQLPLITKHVSLVQRLLDDAMADDSGAGILHGLLADINIIARECYSCAAHFYKKQDFGTTISALTSAFELAESYMEYVMCNPKATAAEIQKAHVELKVDSIASLMAFCYHEKGDLLKSRVCVEHSILYCSDVHDQIPLKPIEKYVSAMLEEFQDGSIANKVKAQAILEGFKTFMESIIHAFSARQVPESQVTSLIHGFRRFFDLTSARLTEKMRTYSSSSESEPDRGTLPDMVEGVKMCVRSERYLSTLLLNPGERSTDESEQSSMMKISEALSARKLCYAAYYESRDSRTANSDLSLAYQMLSDSISSLLRSSTTSIVDLGGAYGWRGVITMEIILMTSYSTRIATAPSENEMKRAEINEEAAIKDVEECVRLWKSREITDTGSLFDSHSVIFCLEAVCNSLSLISCPFLERSARKLLEKVQSSTSAAADLPMSWPPPSLELLSCCLEEPVEDERSSFKSGAALLRDLPQFHEVDAQISFGVKHQSIDDHQTSVRHLRNVVEMLGAIKTKGVSGGVSKSTVLKAMGMRELLVHLVLSDIHFSEGRGQLAISEAKTALSICWKLSKKFASSSSSLDEDSHFGIPEKIKNPDGSGKSHGSKNSSLIYFRALEFSSWDILHATKLVLCRIGSLYSLTDQPHR